MRTDLPGLESGGLFSPPYPLVDALTLSATSASFANKPCIACRKLVPTFAVGFSGVDSGGRKGTS